MIPFRATYRVQLHHGFDLHAARELVPYLARLGVSHLYASPITAAVPGSTHGYDVIDPTEVNPELGGRPALDALVDELHAHSLGLLVDIVPNHMATRGPWWDDTLRQGQDAEHAPVFDIDWDRADGRVVLPVLGAPVDALVDRGDLVLDRSAAGGPAVRLGDRAFPLAPGSDLDAPIPVLLAAQHYELVEWSRDRDRRNYRRFFDIDDLIGVRVEDPAVFDRTHALILELVAQGAIDGLRVDHIDGLRDPGAYLERLRDAIGPDRLLVVEKILGDGEELPIDWPVDGTTGYEDLAALDALFVDPRGLARLTHTWIVDEGCVSFADAEVDGKELMLRTSFPAELSALAIRLPERVREPELAEATLALPVYRTYVDDTGVRPEDAARIDAAAGPGSPLARALERTDPDADPQLVLGWQQLTGPVTAKGREDTAFYRYAPLLSRCEVGAEPDDPLTDAVAALHARNAGRLARWRRGLTATSTHDTKRSEDVRARIAALSELADGYHEALALWRAAVAPGLGPLEARLIVQHLLGAWPGGGGDLAPADRDRFADRIAGMLEKSLREAKLHTTWAEPDAPYEASVIDAARRTIADGSFLAHFAAIRGRAEIIGAEHSLALTVLKIAGPGIPDVYQGTEGGMLSLVDPDNRRPVDFAALQRALDIDQPDADLPADLSTAKVAVTARALRARTSTPDLFVAGAYEPLDAGPGRVGFVRRSGDHVAIVLARTFGPVGDGPVALAAPAAVKLVDALTGRAYPAASTLDPTAVLAELPVALLLG
ncbi:MAG: malto-oligosyltrehalose synthase [Actinomycetia bacterium]|nr:malto-oligosyltrehalose synthase [Actinomycetes bacterium]